MVVLLRSLWSDEAGFVVSAELILVATIAVLSMIVGLTSISHAVNGELHDVARGFEALNQNPRYAGLDARQPLGPLQTGDILGEGRL